MRSLPPRLQENLFADTLKKEEFACKQLFLKLGDMHIHVLNQIEHCIAIGLLHLQPCNTDERSPLRMEASVQFARQLTRMQPLRVQATSRDGDSVSHASRLHCSCKHFPLRMQIDSLLNAAIKDAAS